MKLEVERRVSAFKSLHKLKMIELRAKHKAEIKELKSELAKWENGVSHTMSTLLD
jgi:hypothetical protein